MGRVRTKTVKKSSRQVIERYCSTMTLDFHTNKKILEEVAIMPSKRLSNKIARFSTHLMERIQKGPVRGISLKLQEEERERRMDFVPEESAIKINEIKVEKETLDMLPALGMTEIPGLVEVETQTVASPQALGRGAGGRSMGLGKEEARMKPKLIKNPKTFEPLDLDFFIFGSAFEAGESSEEQDGRNNVSHEVEKLTQEKKKKKEEEMEENKGSDIDLDLSLSQPGLVCKDKSSSSTSQNSCISADISLLFEASTLIVMGCINCHLYVMVSRQHLRCPKCNSCLLLDIFQPYSACN